MYKQQRKTLDQISKYFANNGLNLSEKITTNEFSKLKIFTTTYLQNFTLLDTDEKLSFLRN